MGRTATTRVRTRGQSMVEMAFVLPILLVIFFGIIEFGWLIFAYSTISQAARNGAEAAAQLPPYQSWMDLRSNPPSDYVYRNDRCIHTILSSIESDVTVFGGPEDIDRIIDYVTISYPNGGASRNLDDRGPIEVKISYPVRSLTPLFSLLRIGNGSGAINMTVVQRRSLESLGRDPTSPTRVACAEDMASFRAINNPNP